MCNNEPDLHTMAAFKMLPNTFSFLVSLATFFLLKQFLHTCSLSCGAVANGGSGSVVEHAV